LRKSALLATDAENNIFGVPYSRDGGCGNLVSGSVLVIVFAGMAQALLY
jgi:hypothetical protein